MMRNLCLIVVTATAISISHVNSLRAEQPEPVVRLTIRPVATTQSSLQYKLLPDLIDQTRGNAATLYLMAGKLGPDPKQASDALDKAGDYLDEPAEKLPRDKAEQLLGPFVARLRMADHAAHREEVQWDPSLREDGANGLLPYLNDLRGFAELWSLQSRLQILNNDWPAAARTISDGFSLARQLKGQAVTVQALVATGIADETLARGIQDWITHGDSPNLYWSLSGLPQPFIDIHEIAMWEKSIVYFTYPIVRETENCGGDSDGWRKFLARLPELGSAQQRSTLTHQFQASMLAAMAYPRARAFLLANGRTAAQVDAMSVDQAVGTFFSEQYRQVNDEAWRAWELPLWEGQAELERLRSQFSSDQDELRAFNPLVRLVPTLGRARAQFARLDREIALLRIVEAVRDYAARHDGQPPASLDDIKDLPIPMDPARGKPFRYERHGQAVTIEALPFDEHPGDGNRYELTIVK